MAELSILDDGIFPDTLPVKIIFFKHSLRCYIMQENFRKNSLHYRLPRKSEFHHLSDSFRSDTFPPEGFTHPISQLG
jgi:hypothetical protein